MPDELGKPIVRIPFSILHDSRFWKIGKVYRVKLVLKQISQDEEAATFELADASSLETAEKSQRYFLTDGGYMKA